MAKRLTLATLSLVLVGLAVGCGSSKVFVREGAEPIDLEKTQMLILPCDVWGFGSAGLDETALSAALFTGCVNAFGDKGISLEPAKPALEAAGITQSAYRLASGAYHMVDFHKTYNLSEDTCGQGIEEVPTLIAKLVTIAAEQLNLDFKPRYIFALGISGQGAGTIPGTLKYRVIATIYDTETQLLHSVTYYTNTMPDDSAAVLAKMSQIPQEAFDMLMEKAAANQQAAEEAAGDGGDGGGE